MLNRNLNDDDDDDNDDDDDDDDDDDEIAILPCLLGKYCFDLARGFNLISGVLYDVFKSCCCLESL